MGCSPSRGNHFGGAYSPFRRGRSLLPANRENDVESRCVDGASGGSSTAGETDGERQATSQQEANAASSAKKTANELGNCVDRLAPQEITVNILSHLKDKQRENQDSGEKKAIKKTKKPVKGIKPVKKKEKKAPEAKVDFPEPLVKAHQAAYGYLNPSMTKYEVLLGLLDHAAQTQLSLQPMVAFMLMRYEEINRGLEEIVEEGEKLLKDNGEHLAWPCPLKNLSNAPGRTKTSSAPTEPPPDLLQQLLQYTIQRMHLVSQSVSGVGDSALEEAVDYFTSVADVLEEKLKVKRASEARLMQLLARIEAATLRKPGPEDSALFSEDSGIGVENESLAGSDRHRHRRESCESSGTYYTSASSPMGGNPTPVQKGTPRRRLTHKASSSLSLNSIDSFCNLAKEQRGSECPCSPALVDDDELEVGKEVDNYEGEEDSSMKCPGSSPLQSCPQPRRLPSKRIENPQNIEMTLKMREAISGRIRFMSSPKTSAKSKQTDSPKISRQQWNEEEHTPKRPQTPTPQPTRKKTAVARQRRTHSADSLRCKAEDPTLLELERTQKDLTQRLERMSRAEGNIRHTAAKQGKLKSQPSSPSASVRLRPLQKTPQSPSKSQNKKKDSESSSPKENEIPKELDDNLNKKNDSEDKIVSKPTPSSPTLQKPAGLYRGRNSVKRLIDTFSQGVEEIKQTPENIKILGPLKGVMKCGVPIIPGLGGTDTVLTIGNDTMRVDSRSSDRSDDVDIDSLPPPPLEVLMDNSFENVQKSEAEEGGAGRGHSPLLKRATLSQRLRASMQSVSVLPSRAGVRPGSLSMLPSGAAQHKANSASAASRQEAKPEAAPDSSAASLPKVGQKVGLLTEKTPADQQPVKPRSGPGGGGARQADGEPSEAVPSPVRGASAASAFRARMLPSTPTASSGLHRRLPSPPVSRRQPTPPTPPSPAATRKLPTPPPGGQWRHPSPGAARQDGGMASPVTYPFKAPSPPASPKTQRCSRENSSVDSSSSSRAFSNARSVFCPASPSLFEARPCPVPRHPQAWTSTGGAPTPFLWAERGRLPVSVRGPRPFVRRSQSDRRPSLNHPPRTVSFAETCGSEPAIASQELDDGPIRDADGWDSQSELTGSSRSASHPDLCIIGQALHLE